MTKKIVSRKEVKHWLGNDYKDWIDDCIYRLMNNQISSIGIRVEMKQMYKDFKEGKRKK